MLEEEEQRAAKVQEAATSLNEQEQPGARTQQAAPSDPQLNVDPEIGEAAADHLNKDILSDPLLDGKDYYPILDSFEQNQIMDTFNRVKQSYH